MCVSVGACLLQHILLDGFQKRGDQGLQLIQLHGLLLTVVTANHNRLSVCQIPGTNLDTHGDTAHFLLGELESGGLVRSVHLHADSLGQLLLKRIRCLKNSFLLLLDRDDHHLSGRYLRRQNQTVVVTVYHDHRTDETGSHTPAGLMNIFQSIVLIRVLYTEGLSEAVTEVVAGSGLQRLTVMHQSLDGIGRNGTGKFLLLGLLSADHGDRKNLLTEIRINIQHLLSSLLGLLCRCMCRMAFLPQEFSGAKEGSCLLLPADYGAPLIVYLRQITVGSDVLLIEITEKGLRGRTYAHPLLQLACTAMGHPCNLRRKALHMILLLLQKALRDHQRKIYIFNSRLLEPCIQLALDQFPDRIAGRLQNHESLNTGVARKVCLQHHIRVPLREIILHGGDRFYHFLVVRHDLILSYHIHRPAPGTHLRIIVSYQSGSSASSSSKALPSGSRCRKISSPV